MIKEILAPLPNIKGMLPSLQESNFIQNRALDFAYLINKSGLTKEEKRRFRDKIDQIKKGLPTPFSGFIDVIGTGRAEIAGIESLEKLRNTGGLILSNHTTDGPIKGLGKMAVISYAAKEETGKEIRWTHGEDKSTLQNIARRNISISTGTILIRGSTSRQGLKEIMEAFGNRNIVGIYPEGDGGKTLKRAVPEAGNLILYAAKREIPIICSAGYFDPTTDKFNISFLRIDGQEILDLAQSRKTNQGSLTENKQAIADLTMIKIAEQLPPHKRGFYR